MPREQITKRNLIPTENPNVFTERARRDVHVSWSPNSHVQVAIVVSVAELRDMLRTAEQDAANHARQMVPDASFDPEQYPFFVWSDVLEREEVNAGIRWLRHSRDKAYGRDE